MNRIGCWRIAFLVFPLFLVGLAHAQGDNCAAAAVVPVPGTYTANGPTSGAGATALPCTNDDGTTGQAALNADWYTWTAPSNGVMVVGSITPGADTRLSVFSGTCANLLCEGGDDDINSNFNTGTWETGNSRSRVAIPVTGGTTYYIEWDDRWSMTTFQWNLTFSADPAVGTTISTFPATEEFNGFVTCQPTGTNAPCGSVCATLGPGWTNNIGDAGDVYLTSAATPTGGTGPTTGISGVAGDKYVFLESSLPTPGVSCPLPYQVAVVTGPTYNTSAFILEPQIRFFDHMFDANGLDAMGTLIAQYQAPAGTGPWVTFFSKTADQGDQWNTNPYTTLPLGTTSFRARWIFIRGSVLTSDMAIDRVQVRERPDCTAPVATATVVENCGTTAATSSFTIDVNMTDFGMFAGSPSTSATIVPSIGAPQIANTLGAYTFGPYPFGTAVTFSLTHASEPACSTNIPGVYRSCCGSSCATAFGANLGVNTNQNIAFTGCPGGASNLFDSDAPVPTSARWWTYTPTSTGIYVLSACDQLPVTNDDTRVSVHTGTCANLALHGSDDDGCTTPTFASFLSVLMEAGTTYYIEWDNAWNSNAHTWSFTGPAAPIPGDVCSDAIPLTMSAACTNVLASSAGATLTVPSCAANANATTNADIWFRFTVTAPLADITITPVGAYYPVLELLEGTCGEVVSLCCAFASGAGVPLTLLRGGLTVGNTYYLRVGHAFGGGDGGLNQFNICVSEGTPPTPCGTLGGAPDHTESEPCGTLTNSELCDAEPITLGSVPFTFVIEGTIQAECDFRDRDFYTFTLPATGTYQVDFSGLFDSRVFFLDANGACTDELVQISSAAAPACATGTITQSLSAGAYALMMTTDGIFSNLTCGTGNDYQITITAVPNLDCGMAPELGCGQDVSVNLSGTGLWNITSCGFNTSGNEAIFRLDAAVAGTYDLNVTSSNNNFVDYFIKNAASTCEPSGWTCLDDIAIAGTNVNFTIATPGQYWILVDAEDNTTTSTQAFRIFCPPASVSTDFCAPVTISCGQSVTGQTTGVPGVFPPNSCPFSGGPSSAGVNYWSLTLPSDAEVSLSTCGIAGFDTRISVYNPSPDCDDPECIALNDDTPGCPGFSSELSFSATGGVTYVIAVHGFGADFGPYQLAVSCDGPCTPVAANDKCDLAQILIPALDDGSGVATLGDNSCAHSDQNTGCDPFGAMQGVWYSFNSGPNSILFMDLLAHPQDPGLTAAGLHYALFDGICSGLGATGEVACVIGGNGVAIQLAGLTPSTNYLLYVWNGGGLSDGTFSVLLRRPDLNDAAVVAILEPEGNMCTTTLQPRIVIRNNGENDLLNAIIYYDVDGGTPQTFNWTGGVAYQGTDTITLPAIDAPSTGGHILNVRIDSPNGAVDGIPTNDAANKMVDISGESTVLVINTDNSGDQVSWIIFDSFFFPVASGGPYPGQNNQSISEALCLSTDFGNCYSLFLQDSGGDGLCCLSGNGAWELRTPDERLLLRDLFKNAPNGSNSPNNPPATSSYILGHEFCLPAGPSTVLSNECGIYSNTLHSKVYASTVPGVLNYQFEFSDPDAGFRRRIALPRAWVQLSEMVTNPLLPGIVYFARVRADQGATGFADDHFGTGCEMGLTANNAPDCTQLIDNPDLSTHSCGSTKAFGGSDKIWAIPVQSATQYRFRFVNTGAGFSRSIVRPSYVCLLSWVTNPLVHGSTYDVNVELFTNGAWGGFCGAACSLTILNPGNMVRSLDQMPEREIVELYPNPVHDGAVFINLKGLTEGEHRIDVEVRDAFGKRISTEQFLSQGDNFSSLLQLTTSLARGIYLVTITLDGKPTTKRLTMQ